MSCTADGQYVCAAFIEDITARADWGTDSPTFETFFRANPRCDIVRVSTETGKTDTLLTGSSLLGHVNTSPTQPHILSYCHEGPWTEVENRIRCLNIETGEHWKVRECPGEKECVGHEYWFADGVRLGYHGWLPDSETGDLRAHIGNCDYRDCDHDETPYSIPEHSYASHIHSLDDTMIAGDQGDYVNLWSRREDGVYDEPRRLCYHGCSFAQQRLHVHPRISPDGKYVLFTSDREGYGNVYLAEIPRDISSLPPSARTA